MATHTFTTMGTVASVVFDEELPAAAILATIEELFLEDDRRFSLYRDDSELCRLARGEITLATGSAELRDAYGHAAEWRLLTHGAFTPERPDGVLDLSGIVKALSIEKARAVLESHGVTHAVIDVGGDAVALGMHRGTPWTAGIVDPADRSRLLCAVPLGLDHPAIATSGTAERGDHIWSAQPSPYAQVTVLARDIVTADVLATAILAGGQLSCDELTPLWDIDVLTVDHFGTLTMTPGMHNKVGATNSAAPHPDTSLNAP